MANGVSMADMAKAEDFAVKKSWGEGLGRELEHALASSGGYLSNSDRRDMMVFVNRISEESGVYASDILGRSKVQMIARIRQYTIWKLSQNHFSRKNIKHLFGIDSSTVICAINRMNKELGISD